MNLFAILDGTDSAFGKGAICSLIAIALVFTILLIIIGITSLIFKWLDMIDSRKGIQRVVNNKNNEVPVANNNSKQISVDTNDDDLMAAILVATIDYRNEIKKDVKLVSVRKVN